jgi:hypothetical protein
MNLDRTVFSQLAEFLPAYEFQICVVFVQSPRGYLHVSGQQYPRRKPA